MWNGRAPRVLIVALAVQLLVGGAFLWLVARDFDLNGEDGGGGGGAQAATRVLRADRFDAPRAFDLIREQVERFGPRPAGSPASRRLAVRLKGVLPRGRFEPVPGRLRNVVGVVPGRRPAIVVGAHYDTVDTPPGNLGANDGAAGTAAVVELARTMRRAERPRRAPELRFVLFDGEEAPADCSGEFTDCGLRGSKAYVAEHRREVKAMILLDYIAGHRTRLPREGTSDVRLWNRLRRAARRVGAREVFPAGRGPFIADDHTPFLRAGIPAIDLIDWSYRRYAHTPEDTLDKISVRSLDFVGETVAELLVTMR